LFYLHIANFYYYDSNKRGEKIKKQNNYDSNKWRGKTKNKIHCIYFYDAPSFEIEHDTSTSRSSLEPSTKAIMPFQIFRWPLADAKVFMFSNNFCEPYKKQAP
jgi:hypothetical protein